MAWGAILNTFLGLGAQQYGSGQQAEASAEAMDIAAAAQQAGTEAQLRSFEEAMGYGAPYREAGQEALGFYGQTPMGVTPSDLYTLEQGEKALRAGQSARGRRKSGSSARELTDFYGQVMADIYNRDYANLLERANLGSQFAGGAGQAAQGLGQNIASTYLQGAQQQIPYVLGQGQLEATQAAALGQLGGNLINYYANQPGGSPTTNTSWFGTGEDIV